MTVTFDDILAARDRIAGQVDRTPVRYSRRLSQLTGAEVWVKFDNLHFTGSFKERGALNRLLQLTPDERKRGVVAASAGNHAQALAYHGARLGVPVTIVMPEGTPFVKADGTRAHGATVVIKGLDFTGSTEEAHRLRDEEGFVFVSAFDDTGIVTGQGVCALEFLEDAPDLEALIIPIGGGGLIAGCSVAAKAMKPDIRIFGVEAAMYPSFAARRRGEVAKCGGQTIAEGIAIKAVGDIPFAIADPLVEDVLVCQEADFETAVSYYATLEKTVAEGAGAGGLAALLAYPDRFRGMKVGLVLCGGNIDARMLAVVLNRELVREKKMIVYRILGDDRPGMLSKMSAVIGGLGGNIIDVVHNRLALDVPAKGAEFDIMVETRGAAHANEIRHGLEEAGYELRMG
ncbi:MAG: threonine ammonia-lyase [Alphaproteobacteria bacterium]|uniref:threonine ammonia-lyase n=1 Tax=Brevundimonas sp. TaxID=1871086 RepID=UPI0018038471|nr:threonine ammonia-lyase [Brevundimonas sp.]MBA3050731.1 threonine ammonia-lyase [Brevundimonas sp.]MBU3971447.1 threonine ammonia-lyase [Alphaproteobacteria bacterium]MBU3972744.1 threonine ammonia-lyase [Alphaproteobacteria bacterium]